jgi:MOSC domain-containing protein YiiM
MRAVNRARAIAGVGLEGDRYAAGVGHFSSYPGTGRALTLIEAEVVEALDLKVGEARRNLTIRGIELNPLVGKRFRIGSVLCLGVRLCEPCQYLEDLLAKPVLNPLAHRGGLRAEILEDGEIHVGDELSVQSAVE